MAIRNRFISYVIFQLIFLVFVHHLYSQNNNTPGYFLDPNSNGQRLIQRLAWIGDKNTYRYQVTIEILSNGTFRNYNSEFTSNSFLDISLSPGQYRFRVTPYDVLNKPGTVSEWKSIEILQAVKPDINSISYGFSNTGDLSYVFDIHGSNFLLDSIIFIRANNIEIHPDFSEFINNKNIKIIFANNKLIPDEYDIVIRNPGGFDAVMNKKLITRLDPNQQNKPEIEGEQVTETEHEKEHEQATDVKRKTELEDDGVYFVYDREPVNNRLIILKPVIWNLGIAWTPVIPLYGKTLYDDIKFYCGAFNFSVIFSTSKIYLGAEFSAFLSLNDENKFDLNLFSLKLNTLLQMRLPPNQRMAINFRLGSEYNMKLDNKMVINTGVSFYICPLKYIYIEAGINFSNWIDLKSIESSSGFFYPALVMGIEF